MLYVDPEPGELYMFLGIKKPYISIPLNSLELGPLAGVYAIGFIPQVIGVDVESIVP